MKTMRTLKTPKKAKIAKLIRRSVICAICMLALTASLAACGSKETAPKTFPSFKAADFEGNEMDESVFSGNKLTILNFWFNGCTACVNEMGYLSDYNKELKEKNVEIIGVNIEAADSEELRKEAADILNTQSASFRNMYITEGDEALSYVENLIAFPSSIVVDSDGNIVGSPIEGNLDSDSNRKKLSKIIDDALASAK